MTVRNLVTSVLGRITDSSGYPVTGTITCYVKGTQTLADIRDTDGTVLANPLNVNQGRCTPFITDSSLTIVLKDSDGATLRTEAWLYPTIGITTEGTDIPAYDTMVAMMAAEATGPVFLMGYNEAGDKPAKVYVGLTERSTETPDGGYLVRGVYHDFIMVDNVIDTRDYGMFGAVSAVEAHSAYDASKWNAMMVKSNALGTRLNVSSGYYELPPSLTLNLSGNGVLCPNGSEGIFDIGGSGITFSKSWSGSAYVTGTIGTLKGDNWNTSQQNEVTIGVYQVKRIIVDSNVDVNASDAIIEFTVTHTKNRWLTNCIIYGSKKLSTESGTTEVLTRCEVNQARYVDSYNFDGTYNNCVLGSFTDMAKYMKVGMRIGNIVDLKGQDMDATVSVPSPRLLTIIGGTISGELSVPLGTSDARLTLMNCNVTDDAVFTNWTSVHAINCNISDTEVSSYSIFRVDTKMKLEQVDTTNLNVQTLAAMGRITSPHEFYKCKGSLIPTFSNKYHFLYGTDYLAQGTYSGYLEQINFSTVGIDGDSYVCVGSWVPQLYPEKTYRVYAKMNEHRVYELWKGPAYTVTHSTVGEVGVGTLYFGKYLDGYYEDDKLVWSNDDYTENYAL